MLQDLEHLFRKSCLSLEKIGFPTPNNVPTELEEAILLRMQPDVLAQQGQLLDSLITTHPNNDEQQRVFNSIMNSIKDFKDANRDDITKHIFYFIGGPGGTGKSALFKKLHAACHKNGLLKSICTATTLAALNFDGATTAHSLFSYPVEDETDIDDQDLATFEFNKERCDFLHEVSVIFWDEFISNDCILMEGVLEEFKTRWESPRYYFFVCAGDFVQVCIESISSIHYFSTHEFVPHDSIILCH